MSSDGESLEAPGQDGIGEHPENQKRRGIQHEGRPQMAVGIDLTDVTLRILEEHDADQLQVIEGTDHGTDHSQ